MDLEQLRNYTLSKPGAEETQPFGPDNLVYKINGKISKVKHCLRDG